MSIKVFLLHMFTEADNQTFDLSRVLWAVGVVAFIAYSGFHMWMNKTFDPMAYGTGLGAALAGGGLGIGAKSKLEGPATGGN